MIDDFEHDNFDSIYQTSFEGNGDARIQSDVRKSGTSALLVESSSRWDNSYAWTFPGDGLHKAPQSGDVIELWFLRDSNRGDRIRFYFGVPEDSSITDNSGYMVFFHTRNQYIEMRKDGSTIADESVEVVDDQWYRGVVDWNTDGDGLIKFTLYDSDDEKLGCISAYDQEYTGGGIGFYCRDSGTSGSAKCYFDGVKITNHHRSASGTCFHCLSCPSGAIPQQGTSSCAEGMAPNGECSPCSNGTVPNDIQSDCTNCDPHQIAIEKDSHCSTCPNRAVPNDIQSDCTNCYPHKIAID